MCIIICDNCNKPVANTDCRCNNSVGGGMCPTCAEYSIKSAQNSKKDYKYKKPKGK